MRRDITKDYEKVNSLLRELKSNIVHAREIEKSFEPLVRTLQETNIYSSSYILGENLETNISVIKKIFSGRDDVHFREFIISPFCLKATVIYIKGMINQIILNKHVIEKLLDINCQLSSTIDNADILSYLKNTLITADSVKETSDINEITQGILNGDTALFVDSLPSALIISTRDVETRAISQPETERDVRGPREAFTEDLINNITMIRRRVKNPNLVIQNHQIGVRSNTTVTLLYFKGIVNYSLVCEVERRLKNMSIDSPETIGVQRFLEEHPYSPFPTIISTERPDKAVTSLIKGKVVVMVDGTPFANILPAVISDFFTTGDDYYEKPIPATILRLLRYVSAFFALTVPALYIAVTAFHPAFIPTPLSLAIGTARERVPFPTFLEVIIMIFFLEIMQEAGIRMPKAIGPAVSIVGGLVIGDAAVRAGLVSSPIVIITAFTAIATFSVSNYRMALAIRVLRVALMILGSSFGIYGVIIGLIFILTHLSIIECYGTSYVSSLIPKRLALLKELTDNVVVSPPKSMQYRPSYLKPEDSKRQNP